MPERSRAHVHVSGRVQGVYFRSTTREMARGHGVEGWVKNLADGRVEAVFEGEPDAVEALIDFSHEGPDRARVDAVDIEYEDPEGLEGFTIRR